MILVDFIVIYILFALGFNPSEASSLDLYIVSLYWGVATVTYTG